MYFFGVLVPTPVSSTTLAQIGETSSIIFTDVSVWVYMAIGIMLCFLIIAFLINIFRG